LVAIHAVLGDGLAHGRAILCELLLELRELVELFLLLRGNLRRSREFL
jgi:hypothetical protein